MMKMLQGVVKSTQFYIRLEEKQESSPREQLKMIKTKQPREKGVRTPRQDLCRIMDGTTFSSF